MEIEAAIIGAEHIARKTIGHVSETLKSKAYWVDTLSTMAFSQPVQIANEIFTAGMSLEDCVDVRKVSIPVAMTIIRPACKLRDIWGKKVFKINEESSRTRVAISDAAFITISYPTIYGLVLTAGGAEFQEGIKAVPAATASMLALGVPYMLALDRIRGHFGTRPYGETSPQ
jgi:hypothetical protein